MDGRCRIELLGGLRLVQGDDANIKVTFPEDMKIAEMILERQGRIEI